LLLLFHRSSEFLEGVVPRKLLAALCATAMTAVLVPLSAAHAHAHYYACVEAHLGAWLHFQRCNGCWDREWVHPGRAFRVDWQSDGYLLVWNRDAKGWIKHYRLRIAPQAYCRAAGI
jgi:hypothetical protein